MALSRGVGSPLQKYIQSNILDVVGCMMRVGELPHKSFGICQGASELKFNFNAALSENSGGGSGANSGSSDKAKNGKDNEDGQNEKNSENSSASSDSDRSKSKRRPRVRKSSSTSSLDSGPDFDSEFSNASRKTIKLNKNADQIGEDSSFDLDDGGIRNLGGDTTIIVKRKKRGNSRIMSNFSISGDEEEETATPQTGPTVVSEIKKNPSAPFSDRAVSFSVPKPKDRGPAEIDLNMESDFSFMNLIKWALIIAIIIIFLVFAGTQLNSIRKGWTD